MCELALAEELPRFDLRFRGSPKHLATRATLYFSGYGALSVEEHAGQFHLEVARKGKVVGKHARACGFDDAWLEALPADAWWDRRSAVAEYLARVAKYAVANKLPNVTREGPWQAAFCAHAHSDMCVIDREAAFVGSTTPLYEAALAQHRAPVLAALAALGEKSWRRGALTKTLGGEVDALAIDASGRLLAIEVKPADERGTTAWAPAQALMYARLFETWSSRLGRPQARAVLQAMAAQRVELGLGTPAVLGDDFEVVPVVAIGEPSTSEEKRIQASALERLAEVRKALASGGLAGNLELWSIAHDGSVTAV
jgi:hypothetical protein